MAAIAATMLLLSVILFAALSMIALDGYGRLERDDALRQVGLVEKGIRALADQIGVIAGDWAPWDATYEFASSLDPAYIEENLSAPSLDNLGLNLVALFDPRGGLIWSRAYDTAGKRLLPPPPGFSALRAGDALLAHADALSGATGLIRVDGAGLMAVASRSITTSDMLAPSAGSLVMGRFIDGAEIGKIAERTSVDFSIEPPGAAPRDGSPVEALDGDRIAAYEILADVYGAPVAALRAVLPRSIYGQGLSSVGLILLSLILAAMIYSALIMLVIDRLVLLRVARLGAEVDKVGSARDFGARVGIGGDDEFAGLAGKVNATLDRLESTDSDLKASLAEKEVLLREIHHRVKNNLQVITSLLNLQSESIKDAAARSALAEGQARIYAMAIVHEYLYHRRDSTGGSLDRVNFREYLGTLVAYLAEAFDADNSMIEIGVSGDDILLDPDRAINCGLIANELVTNSLKHGYPGERRGRIGIEIARAGAGGAALAVRDDGVGLPPSFDPSKTESMGWQLVYNLTLQLGGSLELGGDGGCSVLIKFPLESPPQGRA